MFFSYFFFFSRIAFNKYFVDILPVDHPSEFSLSIFCHFFSETETETETKTETVIQEKCCALLRRFHETCKPAFGTSVLNMKKCPSFKVDQN